MIHTFRVLFSLGPFAVAFVRDRRRWLFWGAPIPRTREEHERRAKRFVATIVRLGPTFVKMAQVFAARADLIPEPYLGELGTLIDQVPPMPFSVVEHTVRESYERGVDEVFESFERTPVAAASLGQVHRARWRGEVVAVKVLRPNVEANVAADLRASRRIQRWVERWWNHPHVKRVRVVLDEFELRIAEEMDFRLEAEHATEIRANFANNGDVVVPRVMHELTRQRVLVMEFVEGTRIDRLDAARVDVPHVVATLVELYVQMMLVDGLFHADPHPGNLMVAADGRIVLLDFGMVVRVPLEVRRTLMRTSIAAIRRDPDAVAQGFRDLGLILPGTDEATVRWLAELLITNAYSRTTTKERIDALLADRVMKTLFDFPIVLPQHLVYFGRTAALIEGVGTRYDPYFQAIPIASPVILRMRSRILRSLGEPARPSVAEIATVAGYALGKAARWVADALKPRAAVAPILLFGALLLGGVTACARPGAPALGSAPTRTAPAQAALIPCQACSTLPMTSDLSTAIERRITDLAARGGDCLAYGKVLESSLTSGRITVRPYMWRVGTSLASGEASDDGGMVLAREIDSLNVGVRTVDDVVRSVEHEAVHLAFRIPSGTDWGEAAVDDRVRSCRVSNTRNGAQ